MENKKDKECRCPVCKSINTVSVIHSKRIKKTKEIMNYYYCSNCLTEFDNGGIRLFNSSGRFLGYLM